jgi:hypothetical protein
MKEYIANKRPLLMSELQGAAPLWKDPSKKLSFMEQIGEVSLKFETEWESAPNPDPFLRSPSEWKISINEKDIPFVRTGILAIPQQRQTRNGQPSVAALAITPDSPLLTLISITIEPELFKAASTVNVNGYEAFGWYFKANPALKILLLLE